MDETNSNHPTTPIQPSTEQDMYSNQHSTTTRDINHKQRFDKKMLFFVILVVLLSIGIYFVYNAFANDISIDKAKEAKLNQTPSETGSQGQLIYEGPLAIEQLILKNSTLLWGDVDKENTGGTLRIMNLSDLANNKSVQDLKQFPYDRYRSSIALRSGIAFNDNTFYWSIDAGDGNKLYQYALSNQETKVIAENSTVIFGITNGKIVYSGDPINETYTTHPVMDKQSLFIEDLETRKREAIPLTGQVDIARFGTLQNLFIDNNQICYINYEKNIVIYDLEKKTNTVVLTLPESYNKLYGCKDNHLVYGNFNALELYDINAKKKSYQVQLFPVGALPEVKISDKYVYYAAYKGAQNDSMRQQGYQVIAKLGGAQIDPSLKTSVDVNKIYALDITTGKQTVIYENANAFDSPPQLVTWDITEDHFGYVTSNTSFDHFKLYLKKL